jgi:Putative MetA-pathway of phenol degradation
VKRRLLLGAGALAACGWLAAPLAAQESDPSRYHLFSPVPRSEMRELSTDRPDTTESPRTVDAGHFQLEMDLIVLAFDGSDSVQQNGYAIAPTNLKLGLLHFLDLQLVIEPYVRREISVEPEVPGEPSIVDEGYGATTVRLKFNVLGNDEGAFALALMPFVSYEDEGVDFGLIVPFGGDLPGEFGYGLMVEGDFVRIDEDDTRGFELMTTATIGHDIVGPLGGYIEGVAVFPFYDGEDTTFAFDAGLTLDVLPDLRLDAGTRIGLAGPIDDVQLFLGVSFKI